MARTTKAAQAERETELEWMRKHLQPGDTLFTILDHVSSSGMSRNIRFVILTCHDEKPVQLHPNYAAEKILGYRAEEALGKNLHTLLAPSRYYAAHHAAFPEFFRTGQGKAVGKTVELSALHKDGR